jgi:tRNA pseudouridine55 synthase
VTDHRASGILPVEKGRGVTSFQVVAHLRRLLRAPKVGHGGTLDPEATGVLPILVGEATKLTPYLTELDKEYVATVRLGTVTDTQDLAGTVLEVHPVPDLSPQAVQEALAAFVGVIDQVPPMYSALHRGGKRLYELAREGQVVEREPRRVTVHSIALEAIRLPELTIRVRCGKGTYVRTLAADLGGALGCGGTLASLVRTRVGPYELEASVGWEEIRDSRHGEALWNRVLPCDSALVGLPAVGLTAAQSARYVHGQTVTLPGSPDGWLRVYAPDGACLGVGLGRLGSVKPERLLNADPARPRVLPA